MAADFRLLWGMKKLLLLATVLAASFSPAWAGDTKYFSRIIHSNGTPFQFDVPSHLYMKINTFTQSGGVGGNDIGGVVVYKGGNVATGATVLLANAAPTGVAGDGVVIAGPITVYVAPVANATLFLGYLLGRN
jgi:hypothetical protein